MERGAWIRNLLLLPSLANPFVRVVFDDRRYRVYPWQSINGETTTMPEWHSGSGAPSAASSDAHMPSLAPSEAVEESEVPSPAPSPPPTIFPSSGVPPTEPIPAPTTAPILALTTAPIPALTTAPIPAPTTALILALTTAPIPALTTAPIPAPTRLANPGPTDVPTPAPAAVISILAPIATGDESGGPSYDDDLVPSVWWLTMAEAVLGVLGVLCCVVALCLITRVYGKGGSERRSRGSLFMETGKETELSTRHFMIKDDDNDEVIDDGSDEDDDDEDDNAAADNNKEDKRTARMSREEDDDEENKGARATKPTVPIR